MTTPLTLDQLAQFLQDADGHLYWQGRKIIAIPAGEPVELTPLSFDQLGQFSQDADGHLYWKEQRIS